MARTKIVRVSSKKKVSSQTQARVKNFLTPNNFFIVRTFLGDAVGCVLEVGPFSILMRIFIGGQFRIFRIPFSLIFNVIEFPCGLLLGRQSR
jgi:hypothetical protein